jgi:cytochrome c oxidase assembly protein subunit 15
MGREVSLNGETGSASDSVWPHRLAVVLACATFPLLFIGGLVTSKGAGLAVPDWPTTFGYNMFLYPWSKMVGDVFYEHSHRLVGSVVGFLTIGLALALWIKERRSWLRWLGLGALFLVVLQGVIGGLRVVLLQQTLAIIHAAMAQLFFALTVSLALFTSTEWRGFRETQAIEDGGRLWRLSAMTTGLIYVQAIFGAMLRHTGERLDAHLLFAALVSLHVVFLIVRVFRFHPAQLRLAHPALWLGVLLLMQLMLGIGAYIGKYTTLLSLPIAAVVAVTTTHLIVGSLMLVCSLLLALRTYRLAGMLAKQEDLLE